MFRAELRRLVDNLLARNFERRSFERKFSLWCGEMQCFNDLAEHIANALERAAQADQRAADATEWEGWLWGCTLF